MDGENDSLSVTGRDVHQLFIDHLHQETDLTVVENWTKGVVSPSEVLPLLLEHLSLCLFEQPSFGFRQFSN